MHLVFMLSAIPIHPGEVRLASFSIPDTLFLVVIALIVFGPKKLPEISRQLGKLLFEFRRASNDFKMQIEEELRIAEQTERQKQLTTQAAMPEPATPVAISAEETVAAAPAMVSDEENTILPPAIQPPSTGSPVSTSPPNRMREGAGWEIPHDSLRNPPTTADEMLVAAREAGDTQSATAEPESAAAVYAQGGEAASAHHG